jgi:broad specificity phosphatase PhoE
VLEATSRYVEQNVMAFTHGTVLTLFVARVTGLEPFALWKRLGLPSFVVLSLPQLELVRVVEKLTADQP